MKPARFALAVCMLLGAGTAWCMDVGWVRTTGRWYVETAPTVADVDADGRAEILAVNLGGQLLRWAPDGSPDGTTEQSQVASLGDQTWSSSPAFVDSDTVRLLLCNLKGRVIALDGSYNQLWDYQLPGETTWGRATAAIIQTANGAAACFADHSGTVTCLDQHGQPAWTTRLAEAPCTAPPQSFVDSSAPRILASAGSELFCLDAAGGVLWQTDLGGPILSKAEFLVLPEAPLILCGAGSGSLFALDLAGRIQWEAEIGDEVDTSIAFYPRHEASPLILCVGLWGNLHAVDIRGRHLWTSLYEAKSRAVPLPFDADGDGDLEILVSTYLHKLYVFDENGHLVDDLLLPGEINSSPVAIPGDDGRPAGALVTTGNHLAYLLHPGPARPLYGPDTEATEVALTLPGPAGASESPALIVHNPHGALLRINTEFVPEAGQNQGIDGPLVLGWMTEQSAFEIPRPDIFRTGKWAACTAIEDRLGNPVETTAWHIGPDLFASAAPEAPAAPLTVWPTPAYASFDETRLAPLAQERALCPGPEIVVEPLYAGEAGQGAFVIASQAPRPARLRIVLAAPRLPDGAPFAGAITLREAVPVGSANGERIADALPRLDDAGLVLVPSNRAAKVWLAIDSRHAAPGTYGGEITITPLDNEAEPILLPLRIEVLPLPMPEELPLSVCTWDYLPNKWFPDRTEEILDFMGRNGINIFTRNNVLPPATADAKGRLTFDWSQTDIVLRQLAGRGKFLTHMHHPPIQFLENSAPMIIHETRLAYLRAFRDHLQERGWSFEDYAFYPADEPGWAQGERVTTIIEAAEIIKEADPNFVVYANPVMGLSFFDLDRLEPWVDQWCPIGRTLTGLLTQDPRLHRIMASKRPVWSYECEGPAKTLSPLCYNRASAWRAHYFGLGGIGFWTFSTTGIDMWRTGTDPGDEFPLVYPGQFPVPSARWEAIRDGLEDVAAMQLLEEEISAHEDAGTKTALVEEAREALRIAQTDVMELSEVAFACGFRRIRDGERLTWHSWTDLGTYRRHREKIARLTLALQGP